ncbi:MAG: hypothetical protein N2578_02940 [Bdellovibrionaceae bacterium]|nr:hypothetical protein [Pseudobdellovibrionaceae bacterium]
MALRETEATVHHFAHKFGVRIYRLQNVGNHLHLVIALRHKRDWAPFIRAVSSRIKQGLEKHWGVRLAEFWDYRPYTRIGTWGREFRRLSDYILKNTLDACGLLRTPENLEGLKCALRVQMKKRPPPLVPPLQMALGFVRAGGTDLLYNSCTLN